MPARMDTRTTMSESRSDAAARRVEQDERFLLELGDQLRLAGSSGQLLFDAATRLAVYLGAARCLFSEIDDRKQCVTVHRDYHGPLRSLAGERSFGGYNNESEAALRAGRIVVNCDTATDPRTARWFEAHQAFYGIRAHVTVPLFLGGQWVSSLCIGMLEPHVWHAREIALLQSVAERAWMSVAHLRAVEALRQSEARKAAILASALDAIISIDHHGRIVEFNPAAEKMFGRPREEALGAAIADLVPIREFEPADPAAPDIWLGAGDRSALLGRLVEVPALRADGSSFPAEIAIASVIGVDPPLFTATVRDISERRRSAEQFRLAVEASPTAMVMFHRDGRLVLANLETERLFGYPRDELIGRPVDLLVPHLTARPIGGERDLFGLRQDGSRIAVEISLNPLSTPEGEFVLGSIVDVTRRRRLEEEREELVRELRDLGRGLEQRIAERTRELDVAHQTLSRSEASFRAVIESAPDSILVHRWGPVVYVNAALLRTLGHARGEELAGRAIIDLVHPEDRALVLGRIERLREVGQQSAPLMIRMLHASGEPRWMETAAIPIEFDGGPAVLCIFRDVTERRRVDSMVRESEARYRALFNDSPISLWEEDFTAAIAYLDELRAAGVGDLRGYLLIHPEAVMTAAEKVVVLAVNQQTLSMYEAAGEAELMGGLTQIFGPEAFDIFRDELIAFLDGRTSLAGETVTRTLTGRLKHISFRLSVVSGHEATWSRVVVSIVDIGEHKQAEALIRSSLREKEVLLKEIHHRVKNNLQVISSLLSLQAQHQPDPGVRAMLSESQGRVRSIALVHEKLYQSHDLTHVQFDEYARELVADLLRSFDAEAGPISCRVEVDGVTLPVTAAIPCGLIVNELVTNSLRHGFPGGRPGAVRVGLRAVEGDRLELAVEDDGIGLPHDLDPRRARSLGLDLVYTFAEQLGAEVQVRRDHGTGFTLVFRAAGADA